MDDNLDDLDDFGDLGDFAPNLAEENEDDINLDDEDEDDDSDDIQLADEDEDGIINFSDSESIQLEMIEVHIQQCN